MIHGAVAGYESSADTYERGRPDYPVEAIEHVIRELGLRSGVRVLDLGAGTGKFTKLLVPSGAEIVAVEPTRAFREKLTANVRGATVLDGTAEAIPLEPASVDAVVAATAFHWFDGERTLAEKGDWT